MEYASLWARPQPNLLYYSQVIHIAYSILHTAYYILHIVYCILHTVYCILYMYVYTITTVYHESIEAVVFAVTSKKFFPEIFWPLIQICVEEIQE